MEIDESMFRKMKYGREKSEDGKKVLGCAEREPNKSFSFFFFTVVEVRKKEMLLPIIRN